MSVPVSPTPEPRRVRLSTQITLALHRQASEWYSRFGRIDLDRAGQIAAQVAADYYGETK